MNEWMKEWMNERMKEWMNERMNEWKNEWMKEWMNERINEWKNKWMKEWMNEWMKAFYLLLISLYLTTSVLKQGGGVRYSLCPAPCSSACPSPFCPSFPVSFPVSICRVENSKLRASTCSSLVSRILFNLQYTMVWPWSKQSITFQNGGKICPLLF